MAKKEISRPPTANIPPFGLRMQPELKTLVEEAARASGRSMNAEVVARLESTFGPSHPQTNPRVLQDYWALTDAFTKYLLTPDSHLEHSPQLLELTEALKRATEGALEIVRRG